MGRCPAAPCGPRRWAFREGPLPGLFYETGELREMKKPSQACLLQIFRDRNPAELEQRLCEGDEARWGNVEFDF